MNNLLEQFFFLLIIGLAVWSTSTTIAVARIFEPVRAFVKRRNEYLGEGVSCQRCISHWVAFVYVGLFPISFLNSGAPFLDFFVAAMAAVAVNDIIARTMSRLQMHKQPESPDRLRAQALPDAAYLLSQPETGGRRLPNGGVKAPLTGASFYVPSCLHCTDCPYHPSDSVHGRIDSSAY